MIIKNKNLVKFLLYLKGVYTESNPPEPCQYDCIEIAPFKNNCQAAVTISADFELSWAFRGRTEELRTLLGNRTRHNHPYLLALFEQYSIPITWATVGHLFLENCKRTDDGRAHPEMPRPLYNNRFTGDWYKHDPCTDFRHDPLWYCPDLIQNILNSKVKHEIGSHSFSHIDFLEESSNTTLVESELKSCIEIMEKWNIVPKSLVFPYNHMGYSHMSTLFRNGIIAVRHRDPKISLAYPQRSSEGIYKLYETMNTRHSSVYDYVKKAELLISEAKKRRQAYHLWFHPSDSPAIITNEFRRIIEYIAKEQTNGSVWVATMSELAAYCEARRSTNIRISRNENTISLTMSCDFDKSKYPCQELTVLVHKDLTDYSATCRINNNEFDYNIQKDISDSNRGTFKITIPVDSQEILFRKNG